MRREILRKRKELRTKLSLVVQKILKDHNLTFQELADVLGIRKQAVSLWIEARVTMRRSIQELLIQKNLIEISEFNRIMNYS